MLKLLKVLLLSFFLTIAACLDREEYPVEPIIEFVDFEQIDMHKGLLTFSFTDGDGDIGRHDGDSTTNDFFIFYFFVENQQPHEIIIEAPDDPSWSPHMKLPYITPSGRNKAISGEIEIEVFMPVFNHNNQPILQGDTIFMEFYIRDRALNKSNVERTPYITVVR